MMINTVEFGEGAGLIAVVVVVVVVVVVRVVVDVVVLTVDVSDVKTFAGTGCALVSSRHGA